MRRMLGFALVVLVLAASPAAAVTRHHKIVGTMTVQSDYDTAVARFDAAVMTHCQVTSLAITCPPGYVKPSLPSAGSACDAAPGFDDIVPGAQVIVKDAKRKTVAVGALDVGTLDASHSCVFTFTVKVPDVSFYVIEVAHRGTVTFPAKRLAKLKWRVALTL